MSGKTLNKMDYIINGNSPKQAINRLIGIAPNIGSKDKESLNLIQKEVDEIYDIMVDFANAFVEGELTELQVQEIDPLYIKWYGYSIREED